MQKVRLMDDMANSAVCFNLCPDLDRKRTGYYVKQLLQNLCILFYGGFLDFTPPRVCTGRPIFFFLFQYIDRFNQYMEMYIPATTISPPSAFSFALSFAFYSKEHRG